MNIFKFIKEYFTKDKGQFLGVLGTGSDTNVYDFAEVVAKVNAPIWVEKKPSEWRRFLPQFQYLSSSCVAFTVAKIAQILYFLKYGRKIKFSPGWIYKQRSNKGGGMKIDNAIALAGQGLPTEELYPSEGLTETQINNLPDIVYAEDIAKEFAISTNWVNMPIDFDTVASTIQNTEKGIMLWFQFGSGEWFFQGIMRLILSYLPWAHSVCAVDAVLFNGVQYIVIEDSAEVDGIYEHRKLINREAFQKRCYLSRYPLNFKFDAVEGLKPKYDGSITSLQDCLKFGGYMYSNIPSTGYYGDITTDSVKKFQLAYNIQQTGTVGPITKAKLLEIYK